jgi:dienelactone hydrolase
VRRLPGLDDSLLPTSAFPTIFRNRFSNAVVLLPLLILLSLGDAPPAGSDESQSQTLDPLVQAFLRTEDADQADRTLAAILHRPDATLDAVDAAIAAGPRYRDEATGLQPGVPIRVKGRTFHYGLYVPASYRPTQDHALVVCLHGAGFTGDAYLERWQPRLGEGYILACPTFIAGTWWTRQAEELVLATIQAVQARYRIDPDRIFLTGMSNGGIGTYLVGMHHAPLFAGLAPMASGLDDVLWPFLENLRQTPVYLIHGARDQVMPVELSRAIAKELSRLGYEFQYREHDRTHPMAGGHFFPREELPALVSWFGAHRRNPLPRHVTVVRDATHLAPFGWVRIDVTDPIAAFRDNLIESRDDAVRNRLYAKIDVRMAEPNRIEVHTRRVRRYSLFLNSTLVDFSKPVTVVTDGRTSFEGTVTPNVETLLRDARRRQDRRMRFSAVVTIASEPRP